MTQRQEHDGNALMLILPWNQHYLLVCTNFYILHIF